MWIRLYKSLTNEYFRNPTGDDSGPWCYTTDDKVIWEPCFDMEIFDKFEYCKDPENYKYEEPEVITSGPFPLPEPETDGGAEDDVTGGVKCYLLRVWI